MLPKKARQEGAVASMVPSSHERGARRRLRHVWIVRRALLVYLAVTYRPLWLSWERAVMCPSSSVGGDSSDHAIARPLCNVRRFACERQEANPTHSNRNSEATGAYAFAP